MSATGIRERLEERKEKLRELRKADTIEFYKEVMESKEKGIPVVWVPASSRVPPEIFIAMDVRTFPAENYATVCCAKQMATHFCEAAEERGFSAASGLCSYGLCFLGMMYLSDGPFGAPPPADAVVLDPTACDGHAKMWEPVAEYYNAPLFRLEGAFRTSEEPQANKVEWRAAELRRLVSFVENHTGANFNYEKFKNAMKLSDEAYRLWLQIQDSRKHIPTPRTAREMAGDLFYLMVLRGTEKAVNYLRLVLEDVKERVKYDIGMVENERFRILYDNIPVWYRLQLFDYLNERGAATVFEIYSNMAAGSLYFDGGSFDPEKPFESLGLAQLYATGSVSLPLRLQWYARGIEEWHCDGAIMFINRSCKQLTQGRAEKRELFAQYGIPVVEFEADMSDPRSLNEKEVLEYFDTFLGMIESRKLEVK